MGYTPKVSGLTFDTKMALGLMFPAAMRKDKHPVRFADEYIAAHPDLEKHVQAVITEKHSTPPTFKTFTARFCDTVDARTRVKIEEDGRAKVLKREHTAVARLNTMAQRLGLKLVSASE